MSDFAKSVALVSEGFCPLCGEELTNSGAGTTTHRFEFARTAQIDEDAAAFVSDAVRTEYAHISRPDCVRCLIRWQLGTIDGRAILLPSRKLTQEETKFLYDRGQS